jgi:hypothetical protein
LQYALAALILYEGMDGEYASQHECWAAQAVLLDHEPGGRPEIERL